MISGPPGAFTPPAPLDLTSDPRYLALMERPTLLVPVVVTAASIQVFSGLVLLAGLAFRETAGAAASFELIDGGSAGGAPAFPVVLGANGIIQLQMGRDGPIFRSGIFLNVTAGSIRGSLWVKY